MDNVYKLTDVFTSPKGRVVADLEENGVVIAKVYRTSPRFGYRPFETKFLSEASRGRFESFCDALSCSETVEILYSNARSSV